MFYANGSVEVVIMAEDIQPFAYTETTAAKEREQMRLKINEIIERVNGINPASNAQITIKQGGVEKGSFTLDQLEDETINLEAGGGGSATFESLGGEPRDNEKLAHELTALEDAIAEKADSSALTTETSERESEDTALWTGVNEEAATRQTEDEALRADIDANAGDISALEAALTQEIADREAADDALDDAKENKLPNATATGQYLKSTNTTGGKVWGDSDKWFAVPDFANGTQIATSGFTTTRTVANDGYLRVYLKAKNGNPQIKVNNSPMSVFEMGGGSTQESGSVTIVPVKAGDTYVGVNESAMTSFSIWFIPIRWIKK